MDSTLSSLSTPRRSGGRYTGRGRGRLARGSPADLNWEHEHSSHKQRLLHLRSQVDTSPPESAAFTRPVHATMRPDEAARTAKIREENMRLLEQLDTIQRGGKTRTAQSAPWQDSSRAVSAQRRRDAEQERIAKENARLLKRLQTARPTYSRDKQLDDFRRTEAIGRRIGRYTRTPQGRRDGSASARTADRALSPVNRRFPSVSAYSALSTDSDTESEDGWLATASAVVERYQPGAGDPTTVEKEEEVKSQMDDAKKLRKALGQLQSVLKRSMKGCQNLGVTSEGLLTKIESATCDAPTCTDKLVQSWVRSATAQFAAFRDSGALLRLQARVHDQVGHELYSVKDHAKAVYVLGKERRDARDKCLKVVAQRVDVARESVYQASQDTLRRFADLNQQFEDEFRSLREHYSSQVGLSLQVVLLQTADFFDGVAAAMRQATCFADEPWYTTVDATTKKAHSAVGIADPAQDFAIPRPPPMDAAVSGAGDDNERNSQSSRAAPSETSARPLYSNKSRDTASSQSKGKAPVFPAQHTGSHDGVSRSAVSGDSSKCSTRTVDVEPSSVSGDAQEDRSSRTRPAHVVGVDDRLRTKPDPELPPPSPHRVANASDGGFDVDSRLRTKPDPELPPQDSSVDDRLAIKPTRPSAKARPPLETVAGVPLVASGDGAGDASAALPEAEQAEYEPRVSFADGSHEAGESTVTKDSARAAPPSTEGRSWMKNQLLKKSFSDYLRALAGNDTSEWGMHPKS